MARTKTRPDTGHSAAHAAADPAPAPGTAPAAGSPAAAVHAALTANPGSAVAVIADAAGTGKPAARAALLAMEKDGTATRVKGAKPGIPDTWTLAEPAPDGAGPAASPQAETPGQPGQDPAGSPAGAAEDETAGGTGQDRTAEAGDPAPEASDAAEASFPAAPGPETAQSGPRDAAAEDGHEDAVPDEQDAEAAPGSDPDDGGAPHDEDAPADAGGEAGDAPDPALVTELTGHLDQIRAAADAAELALTASGDLKTVLAGLDEIYEQAAQARRALKAAASGRKAPAVRPGGLRDKVLAHLNEHPDKEFTPHEIHKVLGHSSGAIANALETLVKLGAAEVATEKPRRFRRAAQPAAPAPGRTARRARSRTAPNWRVPREHPPRQPGRQRAAPVPRRQAAAVVHAAALGVRRHLRRRAAARRAAPARADPGRSLGARLRAGPRPRQRAARRLPDRPRPGLQPRVRHDHRPRRAGHPRHPGRPQRRAGRAAADRRLPPPVQGRRDRPGGNPGLRAHRRRDPAHPQRRGSRPAPPGAAPGHRATPAAPQRRRPPMLTGITTRTSTPQEDAEPWPGGSAQPVLDYLTGTLGMTGAAARELLTAARTAQAGTGPGTLADYPIPGGDAHLLIHYAPGSRAYRFKLTAPEPDPAPGNPPAQKDPRAAGKRRTAARPATGAAPPGCQPRRAGRHGRGRRRSRSPSGTT